jgi:PAS domain S-box-containing protein
MRRSTARSGLPVRERLLAAITESASTIICARDTQGRYVLVNRRFEGTFHVKRRYVIGRTDEDLFGSDIASRHRAIDVRILTSGVPEQAEETVPVQGKRHEFLSFRFPIAGVGRGWAGVGCIAAEISGRTKAASELRKKEAALRDSHKALRALTASLVKAEESERSRLSRELHDDFSQKLAVMALDVGSLTGAPARLKAGEVATQMRALQSRL